MISGPPTSRSLTLRILKFSSSIAYVAAAVSTLLIAALAFFFVRWCLANAAANMTDSKEVAEYSAEMSPSDPRTHFSAAVLLEKTFLPADYERSLAEYETAATLAPSNYLVWTEFGRALDRHGEEARAEIALRKALELAPNYASTKWALGNFLLRHGRSEEAFAKLREAVESDASLADPTVQSALAWFDGSIDDVTQSIGNSPVVRASMIKVLVRQKRIDDAFRLWRTESNSDRTLFKDTDALLLTSLIAEKRYASAYTVFLSGRGSGSGDSLVTNGGFEEPVQVQQTTPFDWQIVDSAKSHVAIIEGQKHSGNRSLRLLFDLTEAKDFGGISQYVVTEPGRNTVFKRFIRPT